MFGTAAYQIGEKASAGPTPTWPGAALSVPHFFDEPLVKNYTISAGIVKATNTFIFLLMVDVVPPVPIALMVTV